MKRAKTAGRSSGTGRGAAGKSAAKKSGSSNGTAARDSQNGASRKASGGTTRKASSKRGSSPGEDLSKMFEDLLRDTYWAEKQLTKALPKLSKAADSPELKEAFDQHLQETEEQISRLEQVFELYGFRVAAKKCEAMEGLVEEGKEAIENYDAGAVRDAALIISAQKVEHYEIAAYGSLRTLSQVLGNDEAAGLLQQTLDEEAETDEKLTQIALSINQEANDESDSEEEDDYDEDDSEEEEETDDVSDEYEEQGEEEEEEQKTRRR